MEYLQKNRDSYAKDSLVAQLKEAGYDEAEIQKAVNFVYQQEGAGQLSGGSVQYAGFWIRWIAMIVDTLILFVLSIIFVLLLKPYFSGAILLTVLTCFLYFGFMTSIYQATLGKMVVGIKVCDATTLEKPRVGSVWIRELINRIILLIQPLFLLETIVAFSKKKQGLHDMIARTVVIHKDPNKKTGMIVAIVIVIIVGFVFVVGIFASITLVALNSARNKAQEAGAKSAIASSASFAMVCAGEKSNLNDPIVGEPICNALDKTWPELRGGEWVKVEDGDVNDGTFKYIAIYGKDKKRAICTERGCVFPDESRQE